MTGLTATSFFRLQVRGAAGVFLQKAAQSGTTRWGGDNSDAWHDSENQARQPSSSIRGSDKKDLFLCEP